MLRVLHKPLRLFVCVLTLCGLALPILAKAGNPASSICPPREARRFDRALRREFRAHDRQLREAAVESELHARVPDCGSAALAGLVDLVYGAAPSAIADFRSAEFRCQRVIARETTRYVRKRIRDRLQGRRGAPLSSLISRVAGRCQDAAVLRLADGRLPAVAEACADLYAGSTPSGERLARCLAARTEVLLDTVVPAVAQPNIVLILTDDQRADTLDIMPRVLRDIAGQGIRFTNAFAATAICGPSRASFFSGLPVHSHGVIGNGGAATVFDATSSFVPALHAAGYQTGLFGVYLSGNQALGTTIPPGWSEWLAFHSADRSSGDAVPAMRFNHNGQFVDFPSAPYDTITDRLGDAAVRFLRRNADRPFFLQLSPFAPHAPAIPMQRHSGAFAGLEPHRPPSFRYQDVSLKPHWIRFMKTMDSAAEPTDRLRIRQLESLLGVDEIVGEILDTLDALGLTNDTIVVFASDHGQHWGEHWWNSKMTSYEESIRIPLVLRYPRRYPLGHVDDALVSTLDLSATFADAAGVDFPSGRGVSIFATHTGQSAERADVIIENTTDFIVRPSNAIRTKDWKYIATPMGSGMFEELYALDTDPFELHNLAFDPAHEARRANLAERLEARLTE